MTTTADRLSAAVLWAVTVAVFAAGAGRLGFYGDDSARILAVSTASPSELWNQIQHYVSGRNLHILWHYLFFRMVGDPVTHLPVLHILQSAVDGLVTAGFFLLLRRLEVPAPAAVLAAGLFSFWPLHGETHFWLESLPMNLLSTLFVLVFAGTSLALAAGRRSSRMWALDSAAFLCALFTYDQVFVVLFLLVTVRLAAVRERRFTLLHFGYAAAGIFWIGLRLTSSAGAPEPPSPSGLLAHVVAAIGPTLSGTLGPAALHRVGPLYSRVTAADWLVSVTVATTVVGLALVRMRRPSSSPPLIVSLLALLFYVAAYLPVWLWWTSARHHYLPSLGLFAVLAVALSWILHWLPPRLARLAVILTAAPLLLEALPDRGESRAWELAFTAKRQLFAELQARLAGQQFLALEDFPYFVGPAFLMSPQDSQFGVRLLQPRSLPLGEPFDGSLGSAPAPRGRFFRTHQLDGQEEFRYVSVQPWLVVRFLSWDHDRLRCETNPPQPPPYQLLSTRATPWNGPFAVDHVEARRDGKSLVVTLRVSAPDHSGSSLAALFRFVHGPRFHPWGRADREGNWNLQPVLLADPGTASHLDQTWRLEAFPPTDRLQVDFYEAAADRAPVLLGRSEISP